MSRKRGISAELSADTSFAVAEATSAKVPRSIGECAPRPTPSILLDFAELQKSLARDKGTLQHASTARAKQQPKLPQQESPCNPGLQTSGMGGKFYEARVGELLGPGEKLCVEAEVGRGHFACVFRCRCLDDGRKLAVKMVRADSASRQAAERESALCRRFREEALGEHHGHDRYLVGLVAPETFEHCGHFCLALELGRCDLQFGLQTYCRGGGFPIGTAKTFCSNIFQALSFLQKLAIIHADLKPGNLLMSADKTHVKLTDFGSAMDLNDCVCRCDIQPRYYRAPEVILGHRYGTQIDVWSAGATLFEIVTGRILFVASDNGSMLHEIMKVCGALPRWMIASGAFASQHFDLDGGLKLQDGSLIPISTFKKPLEPVQDDLEVLLDRNAAAHIGDLSDFITKCLISNPSERLLPELALEHRFLKAGDSMETLQR